MTLTTVPELRLTCPLWARRNLPPRQRVIVYVVGALVWSSPKDLLSTLADVMKRGEVVSENIVLDACRQVIVSVRQPKAEWIARLGTVRLSGAAPWQQERAVVGMVKSPVEGSTVVMVKLERPVTLSDFVHPVCLPEEGASLNLSYCNTLGWTRNRELLKRIELKASSMQSCENISIPTVNSFCSEPAYPTIGCNLIIELVAPSISSDIKLFIDRCIVMKCWFMSAQGNVGANKDAAQRLCQGMS
uniref:Peptidase S1 domain-containing protein n=1 Tax=Timema monikensis TaxID=170555 RepID=A0A7R9HVS5_9NEOP|nr:unnamed protein product [Timema monikensis]